MVSEPATGENVGSNQSYESHDQGLEESIHSFTLTSQKAHRVVVGNSEWAGFAGAGYLSGSDLSTGPANASSGIKRDLSASRLVIFLLCVQEPVDFTNFN